MSERTLLRDLEELREEMEGRRGEPVIFDEGMWKLCNERARGLIDRRDYQELRKLYLHMAEFLEKEGKDCFCVLEEAARAQLLQLIKAGVKAVEISCRDDSCPECRGQEGISWSTDRALAEMPLPNASCTHRATAAEKCRFCRCEYDPAEA